MFLDSEDRRLPRRHKSWHRPSYPEAELAPMWQPACATADGAELGAEIHDAELSTVPLLLLRQSPLLWPCLVTVDAKRIFYA